MLTLTHREASRFARALDGDTAAASAYGHLLRLAEALSAAPAVQPAAAFHDNLRASLVSTAATELRPAAKVSPEWPHQRPRRRLVAAAAALAVLFGATGTAIAARNAEPGDLLYPVREWMEGVGVAEPFDDRSAYMTPGVVVDPPVHRERSQAQVDALLGRTTHPVTPTGAPGTAGAQQPGAAAPGATLAGDDGLVDPNGSVLGDEGLLGTEGPVIGDDGLVGSDGPVLGGGGLLGNDGPVLGDDGLTGTDGPVLGDDGALGTNGPLLGDDGLLSGVDDTLDDPLGVASLP
ncbi:MAG TPA: hypothetical protein VFH02_05960 [Jiangellaceae bacterium]|nr:hypothetical protein [Jiangellaceae bacterium]